MRPRLSDPIRLGALVAVLLAVLASLTAPLASLTAPLASLTGPLASLTGPLASLTGPGVPSPGWPPLDSPPAALRWLDHADPVALAFVLVRIGAVAVTAHLLVTTLAAIALSRRGPGHRGRGRVGRAADRVTLPAVVRLARRSAGVGLTASVVVTVVPSVTAPSSSDPRPTVRDKREPTGDPTVTMVAIDDADPPDGARGADPPAPTQQMLPQTAPPAPDRPSPPPTTAPDPESSAPTPSAVPEPTAPARPPVESVDPPPGEREPDGPTWTIAPGEHLWAVAAETLHDHWHDEPTDAQTASYLGVLITTNRGRLVDPDNPDLVHPGQVFTLPPVPSAPVTGQAW